MKQYSLKWIILIILSVVWGSSFILIKLGLNGLTALQLGSLRIIFAGLFLFLIGFKSLKKIERKDYKWIVITGVLGTFFPVFLFAYAETEIDSSIASILNSLTPLNTLIFGFFAFKMSFSKKQSLGVIVGLAGTLLLIFEGAQVNPNQNYYYAFLVLIASILYAFNVNILKKHLNHVSAMSIAVGNFVVIMIPTIILLIYSGFLEQKIIGNSLVIDALIYVIILSIFGTGLAKILFNKLVQVSTPVFSSSVTYTIPIMALFWGFLDGERLNVIQIFATVIILFGVYLVNKKA